MTFLEDFHDPVVVNSVCAVSVSHSVPLPSFLLLLKAQQGCDCFRDRHSVLTAPLLLEHYSPAMRGETRCQSPIHLRDKTAQKPLVYGKGA